MKRWVLILFMGGSACVGWGGISTEPAGDLSGGLSQAVAKMAESAKKSAQDYAAMAEETLRVGQRPDAIDKFNQSSQETKDPQAPWRNMVGDALAGVDEGEKLDARAADWPRLREELKKLQPPRPPPSKDKKDSKDKKKDKNKKDEKSGKEKGEPQEKDKGKGEKSEEKEGQKGEEGEQGDSQSPPSDGKGGKKGEQGKDGESSQGEGGEANENEKGEKEKGEGGKGEKGQQEAKGKGKDPNQVKDYSNSKEGEGKMRDRAEEKDLAGIQDKSAGFGGMGEEKKEQAKKEGAQEAGKGKEDAKKGEKEAPNGMRMVGGGSGKKKQEESADAYTLEAAARLDQVKQSDSPALLQQRLQPKDQRPSPSSTAKPW